MTTQAEVRLPLLRALADARWPLICALGVLLAAQSLLPAATAVTMAVLVGRVQGVASSALFDAALLPLAAFGAVLLLGHVLEAVAGPLTYLARSRINGAHRARLTALAASSARIDALESPEAQRLIREAKAEPENWTERTPADGALGRLRRAIGFTGLIGSCAVLAGYAWWPIPALLIPAGFNQYLRNRQAHLFTRVWRAGIEHGMHAEAWKEAVTAPGTAMEQRVFGFGDWLIERIQRHAREMFEPIWVVFRRLLFNEWTQFALVGAPLIGVYWAVAAGTARGHRSIAVETAVFAAGWSVLQALGYSEDVRGIRAATESLAAFARLRVVLGAGAEAEGAAPLADRVPPTAPALVRFHEVCFTYPGTERLVLDRLDLEIRPGELLAIVGLNGAGKSTLIKLLSGLYEPAGGRITADGVDLAELGTDAWRAQISVVFQDFVRYRLSLEDNITLGNAHVPPDPDAVRAAARDAGLDAILGRLPQGWNTPLARSRTGGVDLSGGQWQQVVLTRALYAVRTGARLLVLDEPTAHLDVRTEFEVFRRLAERRGSTSVVLISHRLSTVRQADRIVLLDGGRVAESGSHDELIARGGTYAELFAIQAERFRNGYDDRAEGSREEARA